MRLEQERKQMYSAQQKRYENKLKSKRDQLFFVECAKEKQLFHWVNHEAPMEEVRPVALDCFVKSKRVQLWKKMQDDKMLTYIGSTKDDPNIWNDSSFKEAFPQVFPEEAGNRLGKKCNPHQETIQSVFAPEREV